MENDLTFYFCKEADSLWDFILIYEVFLFNVEDEVRWRR